MGTQTSAWAALSRRALLAILFLLLVGFPLSARAQETPSQMREAGSPVAADGRGPSDPKELEAFLDSFFDEEMSASHVPGAVFALVKDGKIFFTKGYGFADLEKKVPVIPDRTVFCVGSVSKLFTATAVMQLVEKGLVNLDDDVNKHLKSFQIEATYPEPVTVANLLTHTGGFDERYIGMSARSRCSLEPVRAPVLTGYRLCPPRGVGLIGLSATLAGGVGKWLFPVVLVGIGILILLRPGRPTRSDGD